jgi:sugar (pentulose or hexulose) kinase
MGEVKADARDWPPYVVITGIADRSANCLRQHLQDCCQKTLQEVEAAVVRIATMLHTA